MGRRGAGIIGRNRKTGKIGNKKARMDGPGGENIKNGFYGCRVNIRRKSLSAINSELNGFFPT